MKKQCTGGVMALFLAHWAFAGLAPRPSPEIDNFSKAAGSNNSQPMQSCSDEEFKMYWIVAPGVTAYAKGNQNKIRVEVDVADSITLTQQKTYQYAAAADEIVSTYARQCNTPDVKIHIFWQPKPPNYSPKSPCRDLICFLG